MTLPISNKPDTVNIEIEKGVTLAFTTTYANQPNKDDAEAMATYNQAYEPMSGMSTGDLWYKPTSDGKGTLFEYSGAAWSVYQPINLTGCTATLNFKTAHTDTANLYSMTTENGKLTLGGITGVIAGKIADEDSDAFTFTKAVYRLLVTFGNGDVFCIYKGSVSILL